MLYSTGTALHDLFFVTAAIIIGPVTCGVSKYSGSCLLFLGEIVPIGILYKLRFLVMIPHLLGVPKKFSSLADIRKEQKRGSRIRSRKSRNQKIWMPLIATSDG